MYCSLKNVGHECGGAESEVARKFIYTYVRCSGLGISLLLIRIYVRPYNIRRATIFSYIFLKVNANAYVAF